MTTTMTRSANTARGLMTDNPVSINEHATLQDAAAFLTTRNISAAPVINDAGRPVGVLSRTDIIRFSSGVPKAPQMLGEFINEAKKLSGELRLRARRSGGASAVVRWPRDKRANLDR